MNRAERRRIEKQAKKGGEHIRSRMKQLRVEAGRRRGQAVRDVVAGWSFVLSVDLLYSKLTCGRDVSELVENLCDPQLLAELENHAPCTDHEHWHFSARLYPIGRSSIEADWNNLGRALGALTVPRETVEAAGGQVEDDAWINSHALHYPWTEPRTATNEARS